MADMGRLLRHGGPSICNIAVTNVCNATCDFCNFAYDKGLVTHRSYIDVDNYRSALDILYRRGVRYSSLSRAASRCCIRHGRHGGDEAQQRDGADNRHQWLAAAEEAR